MGKWTNISLTWILRPFGDDSPQSNYDYSEVAVRSLSFTHIYIDTYDCLYYTPQTIFNLYIYMIIYGGQNTKLSC